MTAATLSGLLGDEARLRVVAAIALGARTIDEVAEAAAVSPDDVRRVLPRLVSAGVVAEDGGLRIDTSAFQAAARERPPRLRELPDATPEQAQILWNFVEDGRLKSLPARASQRRVVLEYLAGRFAEETDYTEPEVNELLSQYHEDYASLRRYLVDEGLLARAHGVYRRLK